MSVFSIIVALLLDRFRPFDSRRFDRVMRFFAHRIERWSDAGDCRHGVFAWAAGVLPLTIAVGALWWFCWSVSPMLGWIVNAVALYLCLGFRLRAAPLREIISALDEGDLDRARSVLARWIDQNAASCSVDFPEDDSDVERTVSAASEMTLKGMLRFFFAPLFWFLMLPGPIGLLLYRLSLFFQQRWGHRTASQGDDFARWPILAVRLLDWLPARALIMTFALVGNFEDVIYCWRAQADRSKDDLASVVTAGAGAVGLAFSDWRDPSVEYGVKDPPEPIHLRALVGLFWRVLIVWLVVAALLGFVL